MWRIFAFGIVLALAVMTANFALHLLNRPSDSAVAAGYLILLALASLAAGFIVRRRG